MSLMRGNACSKEMLSGSIIPRESRDSQATTSLARPLCHHKKDQWSSLQNSTKPKVKTQTCASKPPMALHRYKCSYLVSRTKKHPMYISRVYCWNSQICCMPHLRWTWTKRLTNQRKHFQEVAELDTLDNSIRLKKRTVFVTCHTKRVLSNPNIKI